MKKIGFVFMVLVGASIIFGQEKKDEKAGQVIQRVFELPLSRAKYKPRLTLQTAMKLMGEFIENNRIDTSKYWFSSARMIQYGGEHEKKQPVWFFEWMNENGTLGDYLHILVSMDGTVWQMPTM